MVTINDIARELGISASTVSRALNGSRLVGQEVRGKVEIKALELGFHKRAIRRHRGRAILNIKLVLPKYRNPELALFYDFASLLEGLAKGFDACGINVICDLSGDDYNPFPHKKGGDIDAFVFAFQQPPEEALQKLRDQGTPFVVLNRSLTGMPCVASDHKKGMEDLLVHLVQVRPNLRPRFISRQGLAQIHHERLDGFSRACRRHGVAFDATEDITIFSDISSIRKEAVAKAAVGYNAFVCVNDILGTVVLQELERGGIKVPNEMMVTGFDNSPLRRLSRPLLTTISIPFEELARKAAVGLQAQILENAEPELLIRVVGELLTGEST